MIAVVSMRCVASMADMPGVAAMSVPPAAMPAVREPADCHCTKPNGASRQRDKVEIHGFKSTRRTPRG